MAMVPCDSEFCMATEVQGIEDLATQSAWAVSLKVAVFTRTKEHLFLAVALAEKKSETFTKIREIIPRAPLRLQETYRHTLVAIVTTKEICRPESNFMARPLVHYLKRPIRIHPKIYTHVTFHIFDLLAKAGGKDPESMMAKSHAMMIDCSA